MQGPLSRTAQQTTPRDEVTIRYGTGERWRRCHVQRAQYCPGSTGKVYLITSASRTVSVLKDIGTLLSKLHVAR